MAEIKESKYDKIRDQCLASGKPWEDSDFPADVTSIGENTGFQFTWKRPHEICGIKTKPEFILDGGDRFDVIQGQLGDCWMLAALASLTMNPALFKRVVPHDQTFHKDSYTGVFRFHFWKYGEWVEVLVDDRLPLKGDKLEYAKSSPVNEFWAPLMEKAYAKFYGNYNNIKTGHSSDAITDFTGSLCETLLTEKFPPLQLSNILFKAMKSNSIMSASVNNPTSKDRGLESEHAYSITNVKKITLEDETEICLIRIRNPWGNAKEWTGRWSDTSDQWKTLSPEVRQTLNHVGKADGEFWIEFTDFLGDFKKVDICYLNAADTVACSQSQHCWSASTFYGKWIANKSSGGKSISSSLFATNPQFAVTLTDSNEDADDMASFAVELTQMNRRRQHVPNLNIGFFIYKLPSGAKLPLSQKFLRNIHNIVQSTRYERSRAVTCSVTNVPGTYVIVPTTKRQNEEGEFMLRVFSETDHKSQEYHEAQSTAID